MDEDLTPPDETTEDTSRDAVPEDKPAFIDVARMRRSVYHENTPSTHGYVNVGTAEEYEKLEPGATYRDPTGQVRKKAWKVENENDYELVPEGETYLDPEGKTRQKPKFESIGFGAQMLHDMARTREGKKAALELFYPGKVQAKSEDSDEFTIDDNGTPRRPGAHGAGTMLGSAAAELAPSIGIAAGGLLGGVGGTAVEPVGGTAAGAFGGMVLGGMAGRQLNNIVLGLAGIHEGAGAQIASLGQEGALAAGGEVLGRGIAKIPAAVSAIKGGVDAAGRKLGGVKEGLADVLESFGITPERARGFLGTTPEVAEHAADITARGGKVPPSVLAPEAPMLRKIEEFDAVFRAQNVYGEAARDYYEQQSKGLLQDPEIGVNVDGLLTAAEKKVSSERAGQLAIAAAQRDMAHDDAVLENAWQEARAAAGGAYAGAGGPEEVAKLYKQATDKLVAAHAAAKKTAETFVQEAIKDIGRESEKLLETAGAHENPGAVWRMVGAKFTAYKEAVKLRARKMYDAAHGVGGEMPVPTQGLAAEAEAFLDSLPEAVRSKYPADVERIARLAGRAADPAAGVEAIPPQDMSFKDLHLLRSWLRHGIDWSDLTPDMRQGTLKLFENKVNSLLHSEKLPEHMQAAAKLLDQADDFYKRTVPFLDHGMVTTVMKGLEAKVSPNPDVLAEVLLKPGETEAIRKVRSIVGDHMWEYVTRAQQAKLVQEAMTLEPGVINAKRYADRVEELVREGIIAQAYDAPFAKKVLEAARNVRELEGSLPIRVNADDTMATLMRKASAAAEEVKKLADVDPMRALSKEVQRIDKDFNKAKQVAKAGRRADPLHFLYEDSMSGMAVRAADKILGSQDLIMAAAEKFGRDSLEFNALRQVYVQRFFQRALGRVGKMRSELGGEKGMTEEVQALMFPGVTKDTMLQIARDMEFLFGGGSKDDFGGSLAAAARVLNPWQHIPLPRMGGFSTVFLGIPGVTALGRFALGKAFATTMEAVSNPNFINWLAGRLKAGGIQRQYAREVLRQRLSLGGMVGAQTGSLIAGGQEQGGDESP